MISELNIKTNRLYINICRLFFFLFIRFRFYYEHLKSDEFSIPKNNIKNGLLCAALYQKTWHRGKIVDVLDDDTLKVRKF